MGSLRLNEVLRFIFFFRLHDYLLCILCGLIAFGVGRVRPYCREFSWTDLSINFPFSKSPAFPTWTLFIISAAPLVVYVLGEAMRHCWLARRHGGILAHEPYAEHTLILMGSQRHGGDGAEMSMKADGNGSDFEAPPLALSSDSSKSQNSASGREPTQEVQVSSETAAVAPACHLSASPSPPPEKLCGSRGDDGRSSGAVAVSLAHAANSATQQQAVHLYTLAHPWQRFLLYTHMWVLLQAFSVALSVMIVDALKVYAGRLRPDFLSRLRKEGFNASSVGVDWCTVANEGRLSFPSGHSSAGFSAFVPLCFYVLHSLHAFRRSGVSLWRILIGLTPLILPITVAVSRTRDNRHNFDDILAGSLIGIFTALVAVRATMVVNYGTGQLTPRFAYYA
ncbi:putative PAP2 superfamily [Leishmania utingensis]|uniref:PAP2 superfamily n=1 Tax=Leishmania utingensis TaxID=653362 RepID=A0AAW3APS9_9TRYP